MKAFIKANPGGTFSITGDQADKFRVDDGCMNNDAAESSS